MKSSMIRSSLRLLRYAIAALTTVAFALTSN
jgi:hypothetical protein